MKEKSWYSYLWVWPILYFGLGFFNILFAWLGMIDVALPIIFAIFSGNKRFCNHLCGRGQLFAIIPKKLNCSSGIPAPRWVSSPWFRYGFLTFFLAMFGSIIFQTWLVYGGTASLQETVKLLWTFNIPCGWAYTSTAVPVWIAQFSFGFYSLMLSSTLLGLAAMMLYRPRTWCCFCPMGTMTQAICKLQLRWYGS